MFVPSSATIIPTAVPVDSSSASRRLTGMPAVRGRSGTSLVLGEVAPQRGAAEVEDDVVERAVGRLRQRLDQVEVVLLGGEAPLPAEVALKRRARAPGREPGAGGCRRPRGQVDGGAADARQRAAASRARLRAADPISPDPLAA